jgi:hypothetical protein
MKIIPYLLYLYLLAFYNTILSAILSVYGAAIDLTAITVGMVALYKRESTVLWFAFFAGIVAGTTRPEIMPWEILLLTGFGIFINQLSIKINLDSMASRMIVLGGFFIVHKALISILMSSEAAFFVICRYVIPSTLYSLVISGVFFLVVDGYLTWPKFKALFTDDRI